MYQMFGLNVDNGLDRSCHKDSRVHRAFFPQQHIGETRDYSRRQGIVVQRKYSTVLGLIPSHQSDTYCTNCSHVGRVRLDQWTGLIRCYDNVRLRIHYIRTVTRTIVLDVDT